MICLICGTPVLKRDSFFWVISHEVGFEEKETDGAVHDDCRLREVEFEDDPKQAKQIFSDSVKLYKRIAEREKDFQQEQ